LINASEKEKEKEKERKESVLFCVVASNVVVVVIHSEVEEEKERKKEKRGKGFVSHSNTNTNMFDGVSDQFHQFIAPRTTLPLHLSFPLHASSTSPTTFLPFDPYNPSQSQFQTNLFHPSLHPPSSPTHKHKLPSIHQTQLPDLTDSWTNDELLALFRIRSTMENWFPEHTWDHVSRYLYVPLHYITL